MAEAILIQGLARSGAGTLTALMQQMGLFLGTNLLGPRPGFPRGLFEDRSLVDINRELLAGVDASENLVLPLPADWAATPVGELARLRATELIGDLAIAPSFGLKDPRLTVTAPLWRQAILDLDHGLRQIIVLRDPLDLARVAARGDPERFLAMWILRMVAVLEQSAADDRIFVTFHDLLAAPEAVARRLQRFCRLGEDLDPETRQMIAAFVSPTAARTADLPPATTYLEHTARSLAQVMQAGDEPALRAFVTDGPGALMTALQAEVAAGLQLAGRGPLADPP